MSITTPYWPRPDIKPLPSYPTPLPADGEIKACYRASGKQLPMLAEGPSYLAEVGTEMHPVDHGNNTADRRHAHTVV